MKRLLLILPLLALLSMAAYLPTNYNVDTAASSIVWTGYKVTGKHTGTVKIKNGNLAWADGKLTGGSFEIDMTSITDTDLEGEWAAKLVGHLKSEDFFAAEQFPTLTFVSTSVVKKDEENYIVNGDLTIRGITKPISLKAVYGGTMTDPWGQVKAGFELSGSVSRKEFGLLWNVVTEAGGAVVSDEVKLAVDVQLVKQA